VLTQLRQQGERIERLSREEHDLIEELHPQVEKIQENVEEIVEATPGPHAKASRQP